MNKRQLKKSKGFTTIEMMIVFVIIAILAVVASKNIGNLTTAYNTWKIVNIVTEVHKGAADWRTSGVYTGITMGELIPTYIDDDIGNGIGTNPFGGDISIAANTTDPYKLDVTLTKVPDNIGNRAKSKYGDDAAFVNGSGSLTVTVGA